MGIAVYLKQADYTRLWVVVSQYSREMTEGNPYLAEAVVEFVVRHDAPMEVIEHRFNEALLMNFYDERGYAKYRGTIDSMRFTGFWGMGYGAANNSQIPRNIPFFGMDECDLVYFGGL